MLLAADERGELEAVIRKRSGGAAALARWGRCVLLWADGERRGDIRGEVAPSAFTIYQVGFPKTAMDALWRSRLRLGRTMWLREASFTAG